MGSKRGGADVVGCVASLVDALACLAFLVLPPTPATGGRLCVLLLLDPVTCVICYWVNYKPLPILKQKLSVLGFYLVISVPFFLTCQNGLAESAALNGSTRN